MFAFLFLESMDPFYRNIASYPTAVFTVALGLCLVFWLGAVLGMVDIDVLDLDTGEEGAPNTVAGLAMKLGLGSVPLTIIISFIALFGWLISYFAVHFLGDFLPGTLLRIVGGTVILVGAVFVAAMITAQVIKPLRKLFRQAETSVVKRVLGQSAVVRTSEVTGSFGEATLADGGAGLILKVRARGDDSFARGDRVVLLDYDAASNTYLVVSEAEFSGA